jgi:uncharacterized protein with von Willebrand factor type A (vWA) domain
MSAAVEGERDGTMSGSEPFPADLLTYEEYLLDPPATVWEGLLKADHAAWLGVHSMDVVRAAEERTRAFGRDLTREAWLGLYSPASQLCGQAPEGMAVPHSIFQRAERMGEWKALRSSIGCDEIAAAFGAAHFARELIAKLPPEVIRKMQEAQRARDALSEVQARREALQAAVDASHMAAPHPPVEATIPGKPPAPDELVRQMRDLEGDEKRFRRRLRASEQQAMASLEGATARTEQALAQGMAAAAEGLSDLKNAATEFGFGWGLGSGTGATRQEIEGLHDLAERLKSSRQLKQILEALGWAKRVVSDERRKSRHGREKFTHYRTQEIDLETTAPEELTGLMEADQGSPIALDFLRRAADGELLHRQYEGDDHVGKGPFVILVDKSGSMRGEPNATACAVELALMKLALEQRRRFVCIPFSDIGQFQVFDPGPRPDPRSLVDHLEQFYGGGTEPYAPLRAAIGLVREDPSLREGDILIITDGAFGAPPPEFVESLAKARGDPGLKLVAVVIRGHQGQAGFADKVVLVSDLCKDREVLAEAVGALL